MISWPRRETIKIKAQSSLLGSALPVLPCHQSAALKFGLSSLRPKARDSRSSLRIFRDCVPAPPEHSSGWWGAFSATPTLNGFPRLFWRRANLKAHFGHEVTGEKRASFETPVGSFGGRLYSKYGNIGPEFSRCSVWMQSTSRRTFQLTDTLGLKVN